MRIKQISLIVASLVIALLALASVFTVWAGDPDSPGGPTSDAAKMYTLEDIYNRIDDGTTAISTTFTEPAAGPGTGTMHTLNDIMAKAPSVDDTDGAIVADVASGKKFWGLTSGQWGLQTGTGTIATYPAPVPKTGQTETVPLDPAPAGSDGDLKKGVAWPSPRLTDNGDGTVTDNLTGLIWLQDANCAAFFSGQ